MRVRCGLGMRVRVRARVRVRVRARVRARVRLRLTLRLRLRLRLRRRRRRRRRLRVGCSPVLRKAAALAVTAQLGGLELARRDRGGAGDARAQPADVLLAREERRRGARPAVRGGGAEGRTIRRARRRRAGAHARDESCALVGGREVSDEEDVRLLVDQLQPRERRVDVVEALLTEVAVERQTRQTAVGVGGRGG